MGTFGVDVKNSHDHIVTPYAQFLGDKDTQAYELGVNVKFTDNVTVGVDYTHYDLSGNDSSNQARFKVYLKL